eukprot:g15722.t1
MDYRAPTMATGGLAALAVYMSVIRLLRFRRIRWMRRSLDAEKDASEIMRQMSQLEFPFVITKALEFALFVTYGIPSISKLLQKTGEFQKSVGKRYDDTDLILREYYEDGPGCERSETAIGRLNAIHGMYAKEISNADMLFTLAQFVTAPVIWIDRFGWRRCTELEKKALLVHYKKMGERMGIKGLEVWETWDDANAFQIAYGEEYFRYAPSNAVIAGVTVDLFVSLAPKLFQTGARWGVYALIDPPLLKAMGFPRAPILLEWFMKGCLLLRAAVIRLFLPPRPDFLAARRTPVSAAAKETSTDENLKPKYNPFNDRQLGCLFYQDGYKIGELGTASCPAGRLSEGLPSYSGKGGGGSGEVICGKDGSPLVVPGVHDKGRGVCGRHGGGGEGDAKRGN